MSKTDPVARQSIFHLSLFLFLNACSANEANYVNQRTRVPGNYQAPSENGFDDESSVYSNGDISVTITDPRIKKFPFDVEEIKSRPKKVQGIEFDYEFGLNSIKASTPEIAAKLTNSDLIALRGALGVVIGGFPMNNSANYITSNTATTLSESGVLLLRGENFLPGTPYQIRLHFYDLSRGSEAPRYVGTSAQTYYMVTDGVNDELVSARARILMRGFGELSDWDRGRYDRSKRYTEDSGSGWCHLFYDWVVKPDLYTRERSQYTHYNSSYWSKYDAVHSGSDVARMNETAPVHGDFFRTGSHAAMIIAFDQATGKFRTLEGNFNNSVELYRRSPGELSWVGHIQESMLKSTQ